MAYEDGTKHISPARLIEILQSLPEGARLEPNEVGNLSVFSPPQPNGKTYWMGYIDINEETWERYDGPWDDGTQSLTSTQSVEADFSAKWDVEGEG